MAFQNYRQRQSFGTFICTYQHREERTNLVLTSKSFPFNATALKVLYKGTEGKAVWIICYTNKLPSCHQLPGYALIFRIEIKLCVPMFVCTCVCAHVCVPVYIHICACLPVYVHMCVCACVYSHVCVPACVYSHVCGGRCSRKSIQQRSSLTLEAITEDCYLLLRKQRQFLKGNTRGPQVVCQHDPVGAVEACLARPCDLRPWLLLRGLLGTESWAHRVWEGLFHWIPSYGFLGLVPIPSNLSFPVAGCWCVNI